MLPFTFLFSILCMMNVQASETDISHKIQKLTVQDFENHSQESEETSRPNSDLLYHFFPSEDTVIYFDEAIDRFVLNQATNKFIKYIDTKDDDEEEFCRIMSIFQSYNLRNDGTNYVAAVVNCKTSGPTGRTLLHCIAYNHRSTQIAKLLVEEYGANPNLRDDDDETPLDYAIKSRKSWDMVDFLYNKSKKSSK